MDKKEEAEGVWFWGVDSVALLPCNRDFTSTKLTRDNTCLGQRRNTSHRDHLEALGGLI